MDNSLDTNSLSLNAAKSSNEVGSIEVGNIAIYANGSNIRFEGPDDHGIKQTADFTIMQLKKLATLNIS